VGDTFGEEALISEAKRNATVTMLTEGVLMRLKKEDFRELMNEPLLQWVTPEQAEQLVAKKSGVWLDVRLPSEYQNLAIEGAVNVPLYFIRLKLSAPRQEQALRRVLRHRPAQFGRGLHPGREGLRRLCAQGRACRRWNVA
jgi:CRP-like cAMP-binding protein